MLLLLKLQAFLFDIVSALPGNGRAEQFLKYQIVVLFTKLRIVL